jgi:hypothetical protein
MFLYKNENEFKCTLCGQSKYLEDLRDGEKAEYIAESYGDVCKSCFDYHFKDLSLEEMQAVSNIKTFYEAIESDMLGLMFDIFAGEDNEEDDVDLDEDLWGSW